MTDQVIVELDVRVGDAAQRFAELMIVRLGWLLRDVDFSCRSVTITRNGESGRTELLEVRDGAGAVLYRLGEPSPLGSSLCRGAAGRFVARVHDDVALLGVLLPQCSPCPSYVRENFQVAGEWYIRLDSEPTCPADRVEGESDGHGVV